MSTQLKKYLAALTVSTEDARRDEEVVAVADAPVVDDTPPTEPVVAEVVDATAIADAAAADEAAMGEEGATAAVPAVDVVQAISAEEGAAPVETAEPVVAEETTERDEESYDVDDDYPQDDASMEAIGEAVTNSQLVGEYGLVLKDLDAAVESVDNYIEAIATLNKCGGGDKPTIELLNIGLEHLAHNLNVTDFETGVTLESFADDEVDLRLNISLEKLEQIRADLVDLHRPKFAASLESVKERTLAALVQHGNKLSELGYSSESLILANYHVGEGKLGAELADTLNCTATLEALKSCVERGNAVGGLSIPSLVALELGLEQIVTTAGLEAIDLGEVGAERQQMVNLEAFDVALEALNSKSRQIGSRLWSNFIRSANLLFARLPMARSALKSIIEKARKVKASGEHTVKVNVKQLHKAGKTDVDFAAYLSEFATIAGLMIGKLPDVAYEALDHNWELATNVSFVSNEDYMKSYHAFVNGLKDGRSIFTEAQLNFDAPGGRRFFVDKDGNYEGTNADAKKLDAYASKHFPTMISTAQKDGLVSSAEVKALTPDEVIKVATALYEALGQASTWKAYFKAVAAAAKSTIFFGLPVLAGVAGAAVGGVAGAALGAAAGSAVSGGHFGDDKAIKDIVSGGRKEIQKFFKDEMQAVADAFHCMQALGKHTAFDAASATVAVSGGFIGLAKASLQAHAKGEATASTESIDDAVTDNGETVSLEADIKKLKSGVRVKYSHGHGKVTKVYTTPFRHENKLHHASKEVPLFMVRGDKHNKLSLHKASALTLL